MIWLVALVPALSGLLALVLPGRGPRRILLLLASITHSSLVVWLIALPTKAPLGTWIGLDAPGKLFLVITSGLFLAVAVYSVGYLWREYGRTIQDTQEGFLFRNEPDAIFVGCLLLFLATMSLVCISQDMSLLWIAVEATTLVSAPLISFHRHHRSLEATWKYLLICSVGIALALLGNFFLAFAGHGHTSLNLSHLLETASTLDPIWLKAAFLMMLVGYGTKMGLAPMHSWLPDAHSEAPSMVSALLSGALLNCAFLGILRGHTILSAAGLTGFSAELLVLFGLLSMGIAAVFLIGQTDYKRLLAYSSIEHMGILALGIGLGRLAGQGAMLHAINHSLTKGWLFLAAGNLLFLYETKKASDVRGILKVGSITGVLWLAGFLAITGSPPFGLFFSELAILKGALDGNRWGVAIGYMLALSVIFVAMARVFLPMVFGSPDAETSGSARRPEQREAIWSFVPAVAMCVVVLILGLYVPAGLWQFLRQAAISVGGY